MNKNKIIQTLALLVISVIISVKSDCQENTGSTIRYKSFTVNAIQHKIMLEWSTDGTLVTNYFEIQKSTDGKNFKTIALVLGADPKQEGCDCYGSYEKEPGHNFKNYYRVKHIDNKGIVQYSETRLLTKS